MLNYYLLTAALFAASVTAAPLPVASYASTGCGKAHTSGYNGPFTITSGGRTRSYKIQVPSGYNINTQYPLIFDFGKYDLEFDHGRGGSSDNQRDNSMYYNYAAASQYVIVYPQGVVGSNGAAWQGPSYANPDVNDIAFVGDLLTNIKANYCINTDKVYASGKSNGAGFVDTLACSDTGDQFAAFAMAAAALYTDTSRDSCTKKRAIMESHGDSDPTIPYAGGQGSGGALPNIGNWVRYWGERNCGVGAASSRSQKTGYHIQTFSCGSWSNVVSHYHMYDPAAHCWPNSKATNSDAKDIAACAKSTVMDYTPPVLDFFAKWSLLNAPK